MNIRSLRHGAFAVAAGILVSGCFPEKESKPTTETITEDFETLVPHDTKTLHTLQGINYESDTEFSGLKPINSGSEEDPNIGLQVFDNINSMHISAVEGEMLELVSFDAARAGGTLFPSNVIDGYLTLEDGSVITMESCDTALAPQNEPVTCAGLSQQFKSIELKPEYSSVFDNIVLKRTLAPTQP